MNRILGGAGAALGAKLLTGFAVVALGAAGAGAATEAAITGSLNPADWGQQVKQQVTTCKDSLRASGVRGIGPCVSAFAKQHGPLVSDQHRASDSRTNPGKGHDKSNGHGKGNNGQGDNGQGTNGQPGDKGHGKPSAVPGQH